ncbi:SDR family NAD(P)-dependent oxidoreductase [Sphingosinicella terrae]|uniref:SDR family NAD(P)-dependent oxidoreductase n=1 Tax=Sphingosinicella terrae TaxID=2172047 RepID=UPI000E0CD40B|nr:SDR family NAD(P)-dependent oxidoreductase [Sphingosinicella terrae]
MRKDQVAVVTGAAGGIGRGIALALGRRQCRLALADVDEAGLEETAGLVEALGASAGRHRLDVADRAAVAAFPETVLQAHGRADILINNAGVAVGGTFEQVSETDFEWLLEINFWGVVRMTRAFLPLLRASGDAHLVNLSSLFGLIAPPGQSAYCASKFAVRGFTESLRRELEAEGARIAVTLVHPGGVATRIADNARAPAGTSETELAANRERYRRLLRLPPDKAGEIIVAGMERRRPRVMVGSDAKAAALIERLAPVTYWNLLRRRMH